MMKISKGLLSFLSGLGFMGLGFYVVFFTFIEMGYQLLGNYILLFSILTSILAFAVVYFLAIAFSFTGRETRIHVDTTMGGFIGGFLTMIAIILMILSFRAESLGLMTELHTLDMIHPVITFFLTAACTILLLWPEEYQEEYGSNRL